jgi:predicted RNA-binding Zn-ribbon protein involved in translation (DUF1610 family)
VSARQLAPDGLGVIYECPDCGERYLGQRRCPDCNLFTRRQGPGGHCPHCDELVTLKDLTGSMPAPARKVTPIT